MVEVFYQAGPLAGLTTSMRCLAPIRANEQMSPGDLRWPTMAYWRRLASGVEVELDGAVEQVAIGSFWKGSMHIPSIVEAVASASTAEHREQAKVAVQSLRRCVGVVLICHHRFSGLFEDAVDYLKADLCRLGRRLEDMPVVVQANFQDLDDAPSPAAIGKLVGVPEHLCVPSVATKCIGVRETLSLLLREIRLRTPT